MKYLGKSRSRLGVIGAITILSSAAAVWYWQGQTIIPGDASDPEQVAFGSRVYGRICSSCHGSNLDGQLGWQQPLKDGTRLAPAHNTDGETFHHSDKNLFRVVKFGGDYLKPESGQSRMPAFEKKLTDDEIWSVIAYIKSNWPVELQEAQQNIVPGKTE